MAETVHLSELTWQQVEQEVRAGAVVLVPVGATEQHGPHLPLATDSLLVGEVARRAAERASATGVRTLVTPALWTGYSPHHRRFAGTVTLRASVLQTLVEDVATSLWCHGFRKILLLNGHGGNANFLRALAQELRFGPGIRVAIASYWDFAADFIRSWRQSGPGGIDHACEMETALMLAVAPHLVHQEKAADNPWFPRSRFLTGDLAIGAPVAVSWSLEEIAPLGVAGAPSLATAERGRQLLDAILDRLVEFISEFTAWNWNEPMSI